MKLSDTQQAALVIAIYLLIAFFGLFVVEQPRYGSILVGAATIVLIVIGYSSWMIDKMKKIADKRIQMYIDGMNRAIRRELEREVQKHD